MLQESKRYRALWYIINMSLTGAQEQLSEGVAGSRKIRLNLSDLQQPESTVSAMSHSTTCEILTWRRNAVFSRMHRKAPRNISN